MLHNQFYDFGIPKTLPWFQNSCSVGALIGVLLHAFVHALDNVGRSVFCDDYPELGDLLDRVMKQRINMRDAHFACIRLLDLPFFTEGRIGSVDEILASRALSSASFLPEKQHAMVQYLQIKHACSNPHCTVGEILEWIDTFRTFVNYDLLEKFNGKKFDLQEYFDADLSHVPQHKCIACGSICSSTVVRRGPAPLMLLLNLEEFGRNVPRFLPLTFTQAGNVFQRNGGGGVIFHENGNHFVSRIEHRDRLFHLDCNLPPGDACAVASEVRTRADNDSLYLTLFKSKEKRYRASAVLYVLNKKN